VSKGGSPHRTGANVTSIDLFVIHHLNAYARVSQNFDEAVSILAYNDLFKAGPLLAILWALWFVRGDRTEWRRSGIIAAMIAGSVAAVVSVVLTHLLPSRPRPMVEPALHFVVPYGVNPPDWDRVSSLPSDHAALFFGLAFGIWFLSRPWGVVAILHAIFFVCLPRAYLGMHYLTDLVAGGLIGLLFARLCQTARFRELVCDRALQFEAKNPGSFYAAMFLLCFEIGALFQHSRMLWHLVKVAVS
jgi:undecaprenyl-diphosphatase